MVEPKQIQLEELGGDCTGPGDNNTVISLTGSGGVVDANNNRIINVDAPVDGTDVVNKDYVDGYSGVGSLASVLLVGNTTGTQNIVMSAGTTIDSVGDTVTINDHLMVNGDLEITGKLTAPGDIDPTTITYTPTTGVTGGNVLWVDDTSETTLVFNTNTTPEVFRAGKDSEAFVAVGSGFGTTGSFRMGNDKYVTGVDSSSNDASLIGLDGSDYIIIGDSSGSGEDLNIKAYAENTFEIIDTNSGTNQARFTFNVGGPGAGLYFNNTSTSATISFEPKSGNANQMFIYGQNSTSANAGSLDIQAGVVTGGTGTGGNITITSGSGAGGGDSGDLRIRAPGTLTAGANAGNIEIRSYDASDGTGGSVNIYAGKGKTAYWVDGYHGQVVFNTYVDSTAYDVIKIGGTGNLMAHKDTELQSGYSEVANLDDDYVYHTRGMTRIVYGNSPSGNQEYFMVEDIAYNNGYNF